jgi:hypothetical protein
MDPLPSVAAVAQPLILLAQPTAVAAHVRAGYHYWNQCCSDESCLPFYPRRSPRLSVTMNRDRHLARPPTLSIPKPGSGYTRLAFQSIARQGRTFSCRGVGACVRPTAGPGRGAPTRRSPEGTAALDAVPARPRRRPAWVQRQPTVSQRKCRKAFLFAGRARSSHGGCAMSDVLTARARVHRALSPAGGR